MIAAVIENHGPPEVLVTTERPVADAPDGWVLVEMRAAAVNRRDLLVRAGAGPAYRFPMPLVLGSDGAGIRRDTGEEVVLLPTVGWGPSEAVASPTVQLLGGPKDGTYAEVVAVPAENLFPRPAGLTWEEAAALPLAALTAYRALFVTGNLTHGEQVLILGVGSGVSLAALELAVHAGASVVVTSSSEEKLARARTLGAEVTVNYTEPGWVDEVVARTGGVDLVLDSVGSTWPSSIAALRRGGRVVACGGTDGAEVTLDVRGLYLHEKSIRGSVMGSPRDFAALLELVGRGVARPIIDSVMGLDQAAAAHARMDDRDHFGKVVLSLG